MPRTHGGGYDYSTESFEETPIENFFSKRIINEEPLNISCLRNLTTLTLKVCGAALAIIGRVTLINVTISHTGSNFGGWLLVAGDFISFSSLSSWALFHLVDELAQVTPRELKGAILKEQTLIYRVTTIAFSILFAFLTKLPQAIIAYQFNNDNIFMPILLLLSNFALTAFSVKKSIDFIFEKISNDNIDNKLLSAKLYMLNKLALFRQNGAEFVDVKNISINAGDSREAINALLDSAYPEVPPKRKSITEKVIDLSSMLTGGVLTLSYLLLLGYIAYSGGLTYFDSLPAAIVLGVLVFLGNMYISKTAILDSLKVYVRNIFSCLTIKLSYYQEHAPIIFNTLLVAGIASALISWGPIPSVASEYFSSKTLQIFFGVTNSLAVIIFSLTPMLILVRHATRKLFIKLNNFESSTVVQNERTINSFIDAVRLLDYKNFAMLIERLNEEVRDKVLEESNLTMEEMSRKTERISRSQDELRRIVSYDSGSSSSDDD